MNKRMRYSGLLLSLAMLCGQAQAMDSSQSFALEGVGLAKCSVLVTAAKEKNNTTMAQFVGWTAGFITASNQHMQDTYDITPWQSSRTMTLALLNVCNKNADMRFGEALVRVVASMRAERLQEKSKQVALTHEDKTLYLYEESIRRVQAKLAELGLYTGDLDGQFNAATRTGLSSYQLENSLQPTGFPDQKTLILLMLIRK